jgi:hypothetical protein
MTPNKYAIQLVVLKEELMRNGYPVTAHALEEAVKAIGWELAEKKSKDLDATKKKVSKMMKAKAL